MKELKSLFQRCFNVPFPQILLPEIDLIPIQADQGSGLLFGSEIAAKRQYLIGPDTDIFMESDLEGYFLIGFWGYGLNSYAFYYSRADSWSKIIFRLPYGGVYMDNNETARYIREFLLQYVDLEKKMIGKVQSFHAMEDMGYGYYKIIMLDGKEFKRCWGDDFDEPNFKEGLEFIQSWSN